MIEQKSKFVTSDDWLSIFFGLFVGLGAYLFSQIVVSQLHAFVNGLVCAAFAGFVIALLQKDSSRLEILRSTIVAPTAFSLASGLVWCILKLVA